MIMRLFQKKPKVEKDDPVFGRIVFEPIHGVDIWCHLPADDQDHMVNILAPSTGSSQAQRDFYASLRNDLASRESECKAFIRTSEEPSADPSDLTLYSVEVGTEDDIAEGQFVIELSDQDAIEIHRVEFRNSRPENYGVDD